MKLCCSKAQGIAVALKQSWNLSPLERLTGWCKGSASVEALSDRDVVQEEGGPGFQWAEAGG